MFTVTLPTDGLVCLCFLGGYKCRLCCCSLWLIAVLTNSLRFGFCSKLTGEDWSQSDRLSVFCSFMASEDANEGLCFISNILTVTVFLAFYLKFYKESWCVHCLLVLKVESVEFYKKIKYRHIQKHFCSIITSVPLEMWGGDCEETHRPLPGFWCFDFFGTFLGGVGVSPPANDSTQLRLRAPAFCWTGRCQTRG